MLKLSKQFALATKFIEKGYILQMFDLDWITYVYDWYSIISSKVINNTFALDLLRDYINNNTVKSKLNVEAVSSVLDKIWTYKTIELEDISTIDVVWWILSISENHWISLSDYNSNQKLIYDLKLETSIELRYDKDSWMLFYCNQEDLTIYYAQVLLVTQSKLFN